jgi:hypothetical protein
MSYPERTDGRLTLTICGIIIRITLNDVPSSKYFIADFLSRHFNNGLFCVSSRASTFI